MITAFAPATVANVFVGFDFLGFAIGDLGDKVSVWQAEDGINEIVDIDSEQEIPYQLEMNTAGMAIKYLLDRHPEEFHVKIRIDKGIPLSSGLGGSAASAVAAVVALNQFLGEYFDHQTLLNAALAGEQVASGSIHADNTAASLYGGLIAAIKIDTNNIKIVNLPIPDKTHLVMIHPDIEIKTMDARAAVSDTVTLERHIQQSMSLTGFLTALYEGDDKLLHQSLRDHIIEHQRAHLIPEFSTLKGIANDCQAVGFTISGAGPSMLGWFANDKDAEMMIQKVKLQDLPYSYDIWKTEIDSQGAYIIEESDFE